MDHHNLSFAVLRAANLARCNQSFHPGGGIKDWSPSDWATAMAGECGEACNEVKKLRRIAPYPEAINAGQSGDYLAALDRLSDELGDLIAYADLLAARFGIDLGAAVARKFDKVSDRVSSPIKFSKVYSNA